MAIGSRGYIGYRKEAAWGVDVTGAMTGYFPFVSEGLTTDIEELMSAAHRGILDEPISYQGERKFGGPLVVEVHPVSFGHILRSALGKATGGNFATNTETVLEDCNDVWTFHDDVIGSIDSQDKKKGTHSVKIRVPAGVADGTILAYEDLAPAVDMSSATALRFWIKSSIDLTNADDLEIVVSEDAGGGFATGHVGNVGVLTANEWKEVTIVFDYTSGGGADYDGVQCVGLKLGLDLLQFDIHIDDIRFVVAGAGDVARTHVFKPHQTRLEEFLAGAGDSPLYPYTFEIFRDDDVGNSFVMLGCVVNTMELAFSTTDKILKATLDIIAKEGKNFMGASGVDIETTAPFVWANAKIGVGGTVDAATNNDLESLSIKWDNKCVAKYSLNNTAIPRKIIRIGAREVLVNFTIDFTTRTEYEYFLLGTERQFQIRFRGVKVPADTPETKYEILIDMPLVRYLTFPVNTGGDGRMVVNVTGKAKYEKTLEYALQISIINDQAAATYKA